MPVFFFNWKKFFMTLICGFEPQTYHLWNTDALTNRISQKRPSMTVFSDFHYTLFFIAVITSFAGSTFSVITQLHKSPT